MALTSERLLTLHAPSEEAPSVVSDGGGTKWFRGDRVVVGAFVVLAFVLRVPTIARSYWVDEAISVGIATHPLGQLGPLLRQDGSPPLWYVLLHFWIQLFGSTPIATHSLSLLVSLTVTPLAYWAGRMLFGRPAALAAAGLSATNPFLGWYATENRMYTLLVAISLVALTLTVLAVRNRSPRYAVGAVVAFAALDYTHNWALYLTAVTGIYLLVRAWLARDRRLAGWVIASGAGVVAIYSPWIPSLLRQVSSTAAPWAVPPGIGDFFADPSTAIGGTIGVIVAPLLLGGVLLTRGRRSRGTSQAATMLVSVTLATTVVGWLAAQFEPSWTVRYLAITIPGWLIAAAGVLACTTAGRRVIVAVCVLLAGWSVTGALLPNPNPASAKDNAAAVAGAANGELRPGDMVVVTQTEQTPVVHYYLSGGLSYYDPMGRVRDSSVVNWTDIIGRLDRADVCKTIVPAIAALPVGARILEVDPESSVGTSGSAWSHAVNHQVDVVIHLLTHEPSLRSVRSFNEATSPKPYSPVIGELFVKQRGATTCPSS